MSNRRKKRAVKERIPKTISLRLPQALLEEIKTLANARDVPYQSLLKIYLAERVARECRRGKA
jgi:predicted DNA binding CopG/RHH family protein